MTRLTRRVSLAGVLPPPESLQAAAPDGADAYGGARPHMIKSFLLLTLGAIAAMAIACGDDNKAPDSTPTIDPSVTPLIEPNLLTPQPPPPLDPNGELTRYDGQKWPYTLYYPKGWDVHTDTPSVDEFTYSVPGVGLVGQLHVFCAWNPKTGSNNIDDLLAFDLELIRETQVDTGKTEELQLNGRRAVKWNYSVNFPGNSPVHAFTWIYYIQGDPGGCSWRVKLIAVGTEPTTGWPEMLDKIAQEFVPNRGGSSG